MPNITEQDIVLHLKEKVRFHHQEAKRIESLLSAFTTAPTTASKKQAAKAEAEKEPAKPKVSKAPKSNIVKQLDVPAGYQPELTLNSKIAYALSLLSSATGEQIAEKIVELQPELEAKKVTQQLSGVLSTLKAKGQLKAVKEGRKDRFSLPA